MLSIFQGFDWEQSARWLRAIRDRFPSAPDSAPYWECRAALEERRGDLPASVQCWEQAIAKGTEVSLEIYRRKPPVAGIIWRETM